ncbi:hypothetical protein QFC19_000809 [Naganishia cerealis]|uniref:Uncharacterized protein n=1 Tax=Naganishia cerealis TaxID=610337 RepID=A0ACC2WKZ8_9TREE|nr:hypothetical protein QFC19_000809 [Naganishia cerealis]
MAADEMSVSHGDVKPSIKMTLEHFPSRPAPEMIMQNPDPDASLSNERHAVSRFDSASSGVSSSAISVALQPSTTPESGCPDVEQQMATPMQQATNRVQAFDFSQQQQQQGFAMDYARMQPQMNIMPPTYHDLNKQHFNQLAADAGWSQFRTFSNPNSQFTPLDSNQSTGQQNMESQLISRSSSTSNQHSSISPAMLSNMVSRMPSQTSAFYNQAEEDDVLIAVASSAAPSDYGGATLSSRNPSPEAPKKSRKRPASGPQGQRGGVPNGDNDVLLGSEGGSGEDDDVEGDPEPEGVERNGMMWGMKTEEYKALSARERKRVRNRISARTFRARRKGTLGCDLIGFSDGGKLADIMPGI